MQTLEPTPIKECTRIRASYNQNKLKFTIYTKREDNNGWRSTAHHSQVFLYGGNPHFYRGTQKKWLKGELQWCTPFYFLEGNIVFSPNLDNYTYQGRLIFNPDRDRDFIWERKGDRFLIIPEEDSIFSNEVMIHCFIMGYNHPFYEVYYPSKQ